MLQCPRTSCRDHGRAILCILIAAVLTWAAHSSAAVVLLVMSLAYSHFVSPRAALTLVLGANLGSAINPLLEGGSSAIPASRRLPIGNLINRAVGVVLVSVIQPIADLFARLDPDGARMAAASTWPSTWRWRWHSSSCWMALHPY